MSQKVRRCGLIMPAKVRRAMLRSNSFQLSPLLNTRPPPWYAHRPPWPRATRRLLQRAAAARRRPSHGAGWLGNFVQAPAFFPPSYESLTACNDFYGVRTEQPTFCLPAERTSVMLDLTSVAARITQATVSRAFEAAALTPPTLLYSTQTAASAISYALTVHIRGRRRVLACANTILRPLRRFAVPYSMCTYFAPFSRILVKMR